jgi:hypothetical protein
MDPTGGAAFETVLNFRVAAPSWFSILIARQEKTYKERTTRPVENEP